MATPTMNLPQSNSSARLGLITEGTGALVSAVGAFSKASSDQATARYNMNLANANALNEARVGDLQAQKLYQSTSQLKGTQRATMAAHGLDLGGGSPLDILTSTDVMGGADQATLKTNTQQNINADYAKADFYKRQASSESPFVQGASSLVTGAGKVAGKWYDDKKVGLFQNGFWGS